MQPSPYPHPQFPDVTLWDLPGAGSPGCPADKYLKQVDFGRYDFFLLVSPRRCGAVETRLASEILRQGKQFYFVRTRTQRPSGFSEAAALQEVREHCAERLRGAGVNDLRVFLVSNLSPARHDFPLLVSAWEHDLPAPRRQAGLLSLPDVLLEALRKKTDMLQEQVLKTALVLGVIQALPGSGRRPLRQCAARPLAARLPPQLRPGRRLASQAGRAGGQTGRRSAFGHPLPAGQRGLARDCPAALLPVVRWCHEGGRGL